MDEFEKFNILKYSTMHDFFQNFKNIQKLLNVKLTLIFYWAIPR